jgi:hypothetical protein
MENGRPITGRIRHEFHIGTRAPGKGDLVRLPYRAVSTDTREARLIVRDRESDTRTEIPAGSWEFADSQSIRLLPQGILFAPFKIYELWYEATGPKVPGIGFGTVRDLVSFLRYEREDRNGSPNPIMAEGTRTKDTGIRHALAFGGLVPVRQRRHDRPVLAQDRRDPPGPRDRPAGHRDQQLDRVLAEGRLARALTATRPPASGCRRSRYRSGPTPGGTSTGRNPASSPTARAR